MSLSKNQIYKLKDLQNPIIDEVIPEENDEEIFLRAFYFDFGKKRGKMIISMFDSRYYLNNINDSENKTQ